MTTNVEFTVLCAMQHLARPAKLTEIAALCVEVNPPSVYSMPLETARGAVQALAKRGLISRPKPTLYGLADLRAVLHPTLVWTLDEPRSLVGRSGFIVEGEGADRRVSHFGFWFVTKALDLSSDGTQVSSDLSYSMLALKRERGERAYRAALDRIQRTAALSPHRMTVELDDAPQFVCGHCSAVVRPRTWHCDGARQGDCAENMPPCKLVVRSPVDLNRALTRTQHKTWTDGGPETRDGSAPALDAAFDHYDHLAQVIKEAR